MRDQLLAEQSFEKKLALLMAWPYQVVVLENQNLFKIFIPELNLKVDVQQSIQESMRQLNKLKQDYFKEMIDLGAERDIPLPKQKKGGLSIKEKWFIRSATHAGLIVSAFVIGSLVFGLIFAKEGKKLVTNLKNAIEPSTLSQEKGLRKFQGRLESARPYLREVYQFIEEEKAFLDETKKK